MLLGYALAYPVKVLYYILPSKATAIAALMLFPLIRKSGGATLTPLLLMAAVALVLGMALVASDLYPFGDSRHSLWILPFIVPPTGVMLSAVCSALERQWRGRAPTRRFTSGMIVVLGIIGLVSYSSEARFADKGEYTVTAAQWGQAVRMLHSFGPHDLLISERSDAGLLNSEDGNLYSHLQSDYGGAIIPYAHTRLLFRTVYMHYDGKSLLTLLTEARNRNLLAGVDRLVFIRTSASRSAIINATLCPALDKYIITFPEIRRDHGASDQELVASPVTLLLVSKQAFFEQAGSPAGKAYRCMNASTEY